MRNKALVTLSKVAVVGFFSTIIAGCYPANSEPQQEVVKPVKLYQIPAYTDSGYDAFLAEVDAGERSQLSFQVPGVIEKLSVHEGQKVVKDQILASLDPNDYQLALEASQAQFELAETRYLRDEQLFNKKLISADAYDQSETSYKAAIANLEEAKTDLSYSNIKAPFDGIVSLSFVKAHQFVGAKQPILNIINNEQLDINISIPVPYVDREGIKSLREGNYAVVFDIHPEVMVPASFKEMSTQANSDTNSYNATVSIVRPDALNILTGMTGQVLIANTKQAKPIQLPASAWVSKEEGKGTVWLLNAQSNTVQAADLSLDEAGFVVDGLSAGDFVVIAGAKDLNEGQVVRAWTREGGI
ncbi:efflux RND transporter periplasmic adaptor subunit [Vibrio hannami]|uniref:efflux RND transporter periplasmic adaptor subunit n=1 Tax=Vibrio hannami TaxID=2717094 RepID=UPI00240FBA07|nr:efflux RND transporter periplasmic adaptor subunit [Vibrio hannami]MDG3085591.1 efflux RND transporter periplasmic adaptor subunit [Vibrio hannami]